MEKHVETLIRSAAHARNPHEALAYAQAASHAADALSLLRDMRATANDDPETVSDSQDAPQPA